MEVLIMEAEQFITITARYETTTALAPVALLLISAFCVALVGRRKIFLTSLMCYRLLFPIGSRNFDGFGLRDSRFRFGNFDEFIDKYSGMEASCEYGPLTIAPVPKSACHEKKLFRQLIVR